MTAMIMKEIRQAFRSFRFQSFILVLVFFALLDPPIIKYMDKIIEGLVTDMQIILPPATPEMAYTQFLGDISSLGALVLVFIMMGAVAGEKSTGVSSWLLTKPVSRDQYLSSKLMTWSVGILLALFAAGFLSYAYTMSLLGPIEISRVIASLSGVSAYLLFIGAVTFFGSTAARTPMIAGVAGSVTMFSGSIFGLLLKSTRIYRYLPFSLTGSSLEIINGSSIPSKVIPGIAGTLILTGLITALSFVRFRNLELE